ncbi:hypothetical protein HIMB5_00011090 [alpha proteobacterium HIMB5]|nr:hypothetical protein HIMB5_00011090 [alpha proteobacterium HIMB5]
MNFKNLNYLIKKDERILFLIIFLSIVFSAFLETISIAIFLPLFNIIFGGQLDDNYLIQIFNNLFYVENYEFSHLLIFIIFVFIFKNLIYLFLIYVKIKMVNIFSERKKSSLLRAYLDQSFFIFDKRNKAELMRNIYVEVENLIDNFILPTIEVTYTVLVLVFVSIFLFFYDAETTIIIFLSIVPIFFVFYSLTKARLLFYGAERALLHQKILKKNP